MVNNGSSNPQCSKLLLSVIMVGPFFKTAYISDLILEILRGQQQQIVQLQSVVAAAAVQRQSPFQRGLNA
jgi:hypothetical protein